MTNLVLGASLAFMAAEVAGACFYHMAAESSLRRILRAFGLGFAAAVVVFDVLPDATDHFAPGYALAALGALAALAFWKLGRRQTSGASLNAVAAGGMALHNLVEGVALSALTGPLSLLFAAGAVLHKLPEGMATYTLLGEKRSLRNLAIVAASALLIPLGAALRIPAAYQQPVMALLCGAILSALATTILAQGQKQVAWRSAFKLAPYLAGMAIGYVSCLLA